MFAYVASIQNLKDLNSSNLKDLKLFCISFLRKGEVLVYVGSIRNLKDLKPVSAAILCIGKLSYGPKGSRAFLQDKFQCPHMVGARRI